MSRPLSPHLFIYKPEISSLFSVLHRASGIFLALGLVFFVFFIEFFSYNLSYYTIYNFAVFVDSFFAWVVISCFIVLLVSFFYHFLNGIRHLLWDFYSTQTLNNASIKSSAFVLLGVTAVLTFGFLAIL